MPDSLRGCCARDVRTRLWNGHSVAASSTLLRSPAAASRGSCFSLAASMRPYESRAARWLCNRTTQLPFCTSDSHSSLTINPGMQSLYLRNPSLFRRVALPPRACSSGRMPTPDGVAMLFGLLADLQKRRRAGYIPAAAFVNAYLGLGENDQAFAWLEASVQGAIQHFALPQSTSILRPDTRRPSICRFGPPRGA